MLETLSQCWNLDAIFPGGSNSQELTYCLTKLEDDIAREQGKLNELEVPQSLVQFETWIEEINRIQDISARLYEVAEFVECLQADNVQDTRAKELQETIHQISVQYEKVMNILEQLLVRIPNDIWEQYLQLEEIKDIAYPLQEKRGRAKERLSQAEETLIQDLSPSGYYAWERLVETEIGKTKILFEANQQVHYFNIGQTYNALHSTENREERKNLVEGWEKASETIADTCAIALNHIAGFRLQVYKHKGWDSVLREPLQYNRLSQATMDAMWDVIDKNKGLLVDFIERKSRLLGLEKMNWFDLHTPLGAIRKIYTYDEAAEVILAHFQAVSPKLADFARQAFQERWIDCEYRETKASRGFAARFPIAKQSRIFMNFEGTADNVVTLAHELGHAFHQCQLSNTVPPFSQYYPLSLGETASTFAETIVANAAVKSAESKEEQIALLDAKIAMTIKYIMGVQANFVFEKNFYERRKQEIVSVGELKQLMIEAQKYAFQGSLDSYHAYMWIWARHFYFTDKPFYNFPYTFGFLFSQGIYATVLREGIAFEEKYIQLLRDTGRMTVEDLAKRHLGFDLTKQDFWQQAMDLVLGDVKEFLLLTEE
ncbi:M3 family oligoendopeptidase [Bacillus sp. DX4.1]|uniref:M3 family oligoendopeptidase n=1 Tax=Bacillus sp. DX4.1 TaxID=3055867 RepID=UPI0025A0C37D|nr:M3 family oligoendopeptidase [Bacillus sp. DX4.1]MDM5187948.1 M3 family oligoendopeptidase [Bacillus sp. DX4.1]